MRADRLQEAYDLVLPVELFSLPGEGSNSHTVGVATGAGKFVWKRYHRQRPLASIRYEHHLLAWLAEQGCSFVVPCPVPAVDGDTVLATPEGYQTLSPLLAGNPPDPRQHLHLYAMGAALGELHDVLSRYATTSHPGLPPFGELQSIHSRVPDPFALSPQDLALPDVEPYDRFLDWWGEELLALRSFINDRYHALPWQVVHRDVDPSNVLFLGNEVTAILDFEFAGLDARALDVAASLKFALHAWEPLGAWGAARTFCRGYQTRTRLSEAEVEAIPWLIRLRDVASFLLRLGRAQTQYEMAGVLQRIVDLQASVRWLTELGDRLVDALLAGGGSPAATR